MWMQVGDLTKTEGCNRPKEHHVTISGAWGQDWAGGNDHVKRVLGLEEQLTHVTFPGSRARMEERERFPGTGNRGQGKQM